MYILTTAMEDPSFGLSGIKYFNICVRYYYIALLLCCFILALGNRPQGAKGFYLVIAVSYALIMVYMLIAAGVITYYGVQNAKEAIEAEGGNFTVGDIFTNATFRNIVISLLSTYALYLVSSLMFFDPAHMFTSFLQYLLLSPSFTNILNVYSFANLDDVSWGNRPEEPPANDLGTAAVKGPAAEVVVPTDERDINAAYEDALHTLASPAPPPDNHRDPQSILTDSYRAVRTNVLLSWVLTNGGLVAGILSAGGQSSNRVYMAFLLYFVAVLAAVRFLGCTAYSVMWLFQGHLCGLPSLERTSVDGNFIEFDPLARVRAALEKAVPKRFPRIEDERLRDLVTGKPNERIDPVFRNTYHPEVLEFLGDRIWNAATAQTLLLLAPRPIRVGGKTLVLGSLGSDINYLMSNQHGARLAKEFKVMHWSGVLCTATSKLTPTQMGDAWEAHLGALFLTSGWQAVLDFLPPLVKREFCAPPLVYASKAEARARVLTTYAVSDKNSEEAQAASFCGQLITSGLVRVQKRNVK
ncbi:hypothetical protein JCM3770_004760 [Rhodotorula araucariae]